MIITDILSNFLLENTLLFSLFLFVISFILSYLSLPLVIYVSVVKNLTASPNSRSSHIKSTPHLGGLSIALSMFFVCSLMSTLVLSYEQLKILMAVCTSLVILFFVGLKDDIVGISPLKKLIAEVFATFLFISFTDIRIDSFHGIFFLEEIPLVLSYAFTIFVFIIIINSFNLIDGIDGLAGTVAIIISSFFSYYFYMNNAYLGLMLSVSLIGSLLAFLRYNVSSGKRKIFMGDVGSLIVGFVLAIMSIMLLSTQYLSSDSIVNAPVIILALFAFPFFDTLRVFVVRTIRGNSPFSADKNHLHHKLLTFGYSHIQSTSIIAIYCIMVLVLAISFSGFLIHYHLFITLLIALGFLALLLFLSSKSRKES